MPDFEQHARRLLAVVRDIESAHLVLVMDTCGMRRWADACPMCRMSLEAGHTPGCELHEALKGASDDGL